MTRYAANTTVTVEKSRNEIERTMTRFGATSVAFLRDDETRMVIIGFKKDGRAYRFNLPLPNREDFLSYKRKNAYSVTKRTPEQTTKAVEQEERRLFRSLANYIKAVLDAIDSGITNADQALLPHLILPSGQTVSETAQHQLADMGDVNFGLALPAGEDR